jgi:hypothetical protein
MQMLARRREAFPQASIHIRANQIVSFQPSEQAAVKRDEQQGSE